MKMASNDFGNVVDTFYQALQKTQTIPGALKAVVDAIPETGALTGKAMETRVEAFNKHIAWWSEANKKTASKLTREDRDSVCAASAWNAALAWAAKRINE